MKSFPILIKEALANGLRHSVHAPRNAPGLVEYLNLRGLKEGATPLPTLVDPFFTTSFSFPFPQLFKGKGVTLLADETAVYLVNEADFTLTPISFYNIGDDPLVMLPTGTIDAADAWQFIDMGEAWILINDGNILFKEPLCCRVSKTLGIRAGCYFRGRVLTGGLIGGAVWDATWRAYLQLYRDKLPSELASLSQALKKNFVLWSTIGQADFSFRTLLYATEAMVGEIDDAGAEESGYDAPTASADNSLFMDMLERGEMGLAPMPFSGAVLAMKPLGGERSEVRGTVIIYGENGIAALTPHTDPLPTFGITLIANFGIAQSTAVGGDDNEHIFLDPSGTLWRLDSELRLSAFDPRSRLDYKEFLSELLDETIIISKDPQEGDYYISNGEFTYLYSRDGALSEISRLITSLASIGGETVGVLADNGKAGILITSDTIDFQVAGLKAVTSIEVGTSRTEKLYVGVQYVTKKDMPFLFTNWVKVNDVGWASLRAHAADLRISIKSMDEDMEVNYIRAYIQVPDKRALRGPYGLTTGAGPGVSV